jgi:hypothetical protein
MSYEPAHIATAYFYRLLGKPKEFAGQFNEWLVLMRDAMGDAQITDPDEMRRFLRWIVLEQKFSRDYLAVAKDPMVSLRKNAAREVRVWRKDNPVIDPDPLWKTHKIINNEGKSEEKKHPHRKPQTRAERVEFLSHLVGAYNKTNWNFVPLLAQDSCLKCKGLGSYQIPGRPLPTSCSGCMRWIKPPDSYRKPQVQCKSCSAITTVRRSKKWEICECVFAEAVLPASDTTH